VTRIAALLCVVPGGTEAGGRLDLASKDQQILQVVNRFTFGARPGLSKRFAARSG
jgi:hypothetical protein